jgi:hypothetical protein
MAVSTTGRTTIVGYTFGRWPTTLGSLSPSSNGGQTDGYVTSLDLFPAGVNVLGMSTPSCRGPLSLNAIEMPSSGAASFGFYLSGAPPSTSGTLLTGSSTTTSTLLDGVQVWLDPNQPIVRTPFTTDRNGYAEIAFPLTAITRGSSFGAQALLRNTDECGGQGTNSSSNAIVIVAQ